MREIVKNKDFDYWRAVRRYEDTLTEIRIFLEELPEDKREDAKECIIAESESDEQVHFESKDQENEWKELIRSLA